MEKIKMICGLVVIGMFLWVTPSTGQVTVNCPGDSLQHAINATGPETTFNVTGTCNENITIGETRESFTINGGGTAAISGLSASSPVVTIRGQGVTVTGFTISGGADGIQVVKGGTATISGNTIQYAGRVGINVTLNSFAIIINNTISHNPSAGINISENSSARIGFSLISDTVALGNTIQNNGLMGINVGNSSGARIVGNTISDNTGSGIVVLKLSQADISDNDINNNGQNGILVSTNSAVSLGELSGDTIFTRPNDTTVNNGNLGLYCSMGGYVTGRLGTLNGVNGPSDNRDRGIKTSTLDGDDGIDVVTASTGLIQLGNATANNTNKIARMVVRHYNNAQAPVYLFGSASTSTNNFVAFGGGSPLGNAATQLDLFTAENATTPTGTSRITIKGDGNVGFGTQSPAYPLHMVSGAHVTAGGVWTDASSREYKDNIEGLTKEEALDTLKELNPVKFAYKKDMTEKHVGFIAEEAPDLIATKDRKGLSPMDIVAVLTKVVQEQQKTMQEQLKAMQEQQKTISSLSEKVSELEKALK